MFNLPAAQMWCLARMFPLLVGDLIPVENEFWDNFLCLLQIEEIVFAPATSIQLAAYLSVLVQQYLHQFSQLHDRSLIPKHHYMEHYPRQNVRYKKWHLLIPHGNSSLYCLDLNQVFWYLQGTHNQTVLN